MGGWVEAGVGGIGVGGDGACLQSQLFRKLHWVALLSSRGWTSIGNKERHPSPDHSGIEFNLLQNIV